MDLPVVPSIGPQPRASSNTGSPVRVNSRRGSIRSNGSVRSNGSGSGSSCMYSPLPLQRQPLKTLHLPFSSSMTLSSICTPDSGIPGSVQGSEIGTPAETLDCTNLEGGGTLRYTESNCSGSPTPSPEEMPGPVILPSEVGVSSAFRPYVPPSVPSSGHQSMQSSGHHSMQSSAAPSLPSSGRSSIHSSVRNSVASSESSNYSIVSENQSSGGASENYSHICDNPGPAVLPKV